METVTSASPRSDRRPRPGWLHARRPLRSASGSRGCPSHGTRRRGGSARAQVPKSEGDRRAWRPATDSASMEPRSAPSKRAWNRLAPKRARFEAGAGRSWSTCHRLLEARTLASRAVEDPRSPVTCRGSRCLSKIASGGKSQPLRSRGAGADRAQATCAVELRALHRPEITPIRSSPRRLPSPVSDAGDRRSNCAGAESSHSSVARTTRRPRKSIRGLRRSYRAPDRSGSRSAARRECAVRPLLRPAAASSRWRPGGRMQQAEAAQAVSVQPWPSRIMRVSSSAARAGGCWRRGRMRLRAATQRRSGGGRGRRARARAPRRTGAPLTRQRPRPSAQAYTALAMPRPW